MGTEYKEEYRKSRGLRVPLPMLVRTVLLVGAVAPR